MTIVLIQITLFLFFLVNLYCEVSQKYRDCELHVSLRMLFMVASLVAIAKASILAALPIVVQVSTLIVLLVIIKLLYDHVLKRQVRIKNFKLKKFYLGDIDAHTKKFR